jgi:hypothetical protein
MRLDHGAVIFSNSPAINLDNILGQIRTENQSEKTGFMITGNSFVSPGCSRRLTLKYWKLYGYERLIGSRRSYITRSDDDYVGEAPSGFEQTKVNIAIIAPRDVARSRDCDQFERACNIF